MNFTNLFGHQQVKQVDRARDRQEKREMNRAIRQLDRELRKIQREVNKMQTETKKLAEQGQRQAMKSLCKSIIRLQNDEKQCIKLKALLRNVSSSPHSQTAMVHLMGQISRCYASLRHVVLLPELQKIIDQYQPQHLMMEMKQEMIDDCMDDTLMNDSDEEDELVSKVLDEIGIDMSDQMVSAAPMKCMACEEAEDDDLSQRLAALDGGSYSGHSFASSSVAPSSVAAAIAISSSANPKNDSAETIGFSVGGAKDVGNFRQCIEQHRMPSLSSITYTGLLYEYFFDTRTRNHVKQQVQQAVEADGSDLFFPSYCYAKTKKLDFENENAQAANGFEYYMTLGLNSNLKTNEFKRKHLNLIIVLDISGSMGSAFSADGDDDGGNKSKMQVASESVAALMTHLTAQDRLSVITFQSVSEVIQSLQFVNDIDMDALKNKILAIRQRGGTNFQCGYFDAMREFEKLFQNEEYKLNSIEYDNRIIFLTDARPNAARADESMLLTVMEHFAENKAPDDDDDDAYIRNRIYTTFIGVGIDFNADLVERISDVRGCNYFTVKSTRDFMSKLDEEFEFWVTPLVFNVVLQLKCEGNACQIEKVFGVNAKKAAAIQSSGEISKINTLFPAKRRAARKGGGTRGGIQLIKLKKSDDDDAKNEEDDDDNINVEIVVSFEDRNGKKFKNQQFVRFEAPDLKIAKTNDMIEKDEAEEAMDDIKENFYDNTGIRKGILLCKYVEIIKAWIKSTNSSRLCIDDKHREILKRFSKHFEREMKKCNDEKELQKEMRIMQKLINLN